MIQFRRALMFLQCAQGLLMAWTIRIGRTMEKVRLPAGPENNRLSEGDVAFILAATAGLMNIGATRTGRTCFFRSYILAFVLRRWGFPAVINVGLRNLGGDRRAEGHCWLTTPEGALFSEPTDPREQYPVFMGDGVPGVRYWAGP
jgi:hypothetical protein